MSEADARIECILLKHIEEQANATAKALERVLNLMEIARHASSRLALPDSAERGADAK